MRLDVGLSGPLVVVYSKMSDRVKILLRDKCQFASARGLKNLMSIVRGQIWIFVRYLTSKRTLMMEVYHVVKKDRFILQNIFIWCLGDLSPNFRFLLTDCILL